MYLYAAALYCASLLCKLGCCQIEDLCSAHCYRPWKCLVLDSLINWLLLRILKEILAKSKQWKIMSFTKIMILIYSQNIFSCLDQLPKKNPMFLETTCNISFSDNVFKILIAFPSCSVLNLGADSSSCIQICSASTTQSYREAATQARRKYRDFPDRNSQGPEYILGVLPYLLHHQSCQQRCRPAPSTTWKDSI